MLALRCWGENSVRKDVYLRSMLMLSFLHCTELLRLLLHRCQSRTPCYLNSVESTWQMIRSSWHRPSCNSSLERIDSSYCRTTCRLLSMRDCCKGSPPMSSSTYRAPLSLLCSLGSPTRGWGWLHMPLSQRLNMTQCYKACKRLQLAQSNIHWSMWCSSWDQNFDYSGKKNKDYNLSERTI